MKNRLKKNNKEKVISKETINEYIEHRYQGLGGCYKQIAEYSDLNFYLNKNHSNQYEIKCDFIGPPLPHKPEVKICKHIGEYFLQFGIRVYRQFLSYLIPQLSKPKEAKPKKNKKAKKEKRDTSEKKNIKEKTGLVRLNKKLRKIVKPLKGPAMRIAAGMISGYYKLRCHSLMPHYDTFNKFYLKNHNNGTKNYLEDAKCDFFIRLKTKEHHDNSKYTPLFNQDQTEVITDN
ncbi:Hypothetical protein CINCED_3A003842 [Cinara cedri]|nr:Hypothetical protein CINCED_3A003842 [Cinara cedri]